MIEASHLRQLRLDLLLGSEKVVDVVGEQVESEGGVYRSTTTYHAIAARVCAVGGSTRRPRPARWLDRGCRSMPFSVQVRAPASASARDGRRRGPSATVRPRNAAAFEAHPGMGRRRRTDPRCAASSSSSRASDRRSSAIARSSDMLSAIGARERRGAAPFQVDAQEGGVGVRLVDPGVAAAIGTPPRCPHDARRRRARPSMPIGSIPGQPAGPASRGRPAAPSPRDQSMVLQAERVAVAPIRSATMAAASVAPAGPPLDESAPRAGLEYGADAEHSRPCTADPHGRRRAWPEPGRSPS